MKRISLLVCSAFFLLSSTALFAQNITYSVVHNEPARDVDFEILGKIDNNYLVYKNMRDRNIIQVFDQQMKELSNDILKEMPGNILNIDFVTYPNYALLLYQYKRNSILHCDALKIDGSGKAIGTAIKLDTTRVGMQSGRDIYGTVYSEDKSNILVYKLHERSEKLHVVTKIYDPLLRLKDSTRSLIDYNDRREQFSPFQITNDGTIFLTKEIKAGARENSSELEVISSKFKSNEFKAIAVNLQQKYIDGVQIKVDNLNNNFIINSFYYDGRRSSSIEGLFTAILNKGTDSARAAFTKFDDSLRLRMNSSGKFRTAFDNLFLKNIFVKRDGSYLLVAEDFYTQTQGGGNSWNRWDYMYGDPYSMYNSFYWNSPYYRYNRFNSFNSFNNQRSTLYFYDNVLIMNIDSSLKMNWNNVILKKQTNNEDDSFLSFGTMITGGEINFLYIEKEKNTQIISNQSISTYGKLYRYPTLKSRERGYQFMPRLSKQVGAKELIVPCVYRGNMCFAKIDFAR